MPFPRTPREVYAVNPLEEVICQLRFPAVLQISAAPPAAFQDAIREDYPWYEEQEAGLGLPQEFMDLLPPGIPLPRMPRQSLHRFYTENRARSITLEQESVAVADNYYRDWTSFRKEIERAEKVLRQIMDRPFIPASGCATGMFWTGEKSGWMKLHGPNC